MVLHHGLLHPPLRRFGHSITDLVQIRGLNRGGPYKPPESISKVYLLPILIELPDIRFKDEDVDKALEKLNNIMEKYFRLPTEYITLNIANKYERIKINDISSRTMKALYDRLLDIRNQLIELGYEDKLNGVVILVFTKQTSPMLKCTPYYVTKTIFLEKPISQVITENALSKLDMSITNIALGIFTKLGGVPWRLADIIPSADVIIGVGRTVVRYYSEQLNMITKALIGSVALIRSDGVFTKAKATIVESPEELTSWIASNINSMIREFLFVGSRKIPSSLDVSIHYSGKRPRKKEAAEIKKKIEEVSKRAGIDIKYKIVHITHHIPHRFMCKKFNMYPPGGFYWILSEKEAFLVPLGATSLGGRTYYSFTGIPHTLKITIFDHSRDLEAREALEDAISEVYNLTYMHLAGLNINIGEAISTKYSQRLAFVVGSLNVLRESMGLKFNIPYRFNKLWFL